MDFQTLLKFAVSQGASDIHIKPGSPPYIRVNGALIPARGFPQISPEETFAIAHEIMSKTQKEKFQRKGEIDLSYGVPGIGRYRVNIFKQRIAIGIVLRVIPYKIQTFEDLHLPKILEKISMESRGLILVTGATGCGKSTTLAAMVNFINEHRNCHIVTIEDPIEFLFQDKNSIITQREVGIDTSTFAGALKNALRMDPDVILVGEMRDQETIEIALTAAETGHLVLSTLHTIDATETVNRIISVFPPYQQKQIRIQLASVLKAIISQRLIPMVKGKGRVPAVEILINTGRIKELLEDKERTKEIPDSIAHGYSTYGMMTFDQSLYDLLKQNLIEYEVALRYSSNPDDFALKVSGVVSDMGGTWSDIDTSPVGKEVEYDRGIRDK